MGNKVRLEKIPKRIISLVPSQTELLFDLGLREEVVGITKFCIHPKEWFRSKPRVGGTKKINLEKIKELQPDLIIGNKEENEKGQIEELIKYYPVWMSDIKTLDDAYWMIAGIGKITGKEQQAEDLTKKIKTGFEQLKSEAVSLPAGQAGLRSEGKKAMYFIWKDPYIVAGRDTFIDHMLNLCGLENVFDDKKSRYPEITAESIKLANPELIFLSSEPFPFKEKHIDEFKMICPGSQVLLVDGELFSWYGSRLLKAPAYFLQLIKSLK
jgi:ABC-type Fe3+-hydroxamate transport system substrate-binding protein